VTGLVEVLAIMDSQLPSTVLCNWNSTSSISLTHRFEPFQSPWRWRQYVSPKCHKFEPPHVAGTYKVTIDW